jgi:hypothetical protein
VSRTIVCIASGPSLTPADVAYCRGRARVLAVNDNYRIAPWADWMYACDYAWWAAAPTDDVRHRQHHSISRDIFMGERWTRDPDAADQWDLRWIESADLPGLSRDPKLIHEGENGGYQAINLAYHFGARRIVLLGYDMSGRGHWFGSHPKPLCDATNFSERVHHFDALAADLEADGIDVVNASRQTALRCFRRASIQEALA